MSRILFVSTSTTVGGAEKTLFSLVTLLDPQEFRVAAVVGLKPDGAYARRLRELGYKTATLGMTGRPSFKHVRELARIIDHERPDIVHAVMYQAIQLCRLARKRCDAKFKLITSPRVSYRTRSAATLLLDRALKGGDDLLIAECESSRRFLLERLRYAPEKVSTIYNGVDLASWPVSKLERQQKRLELRLGAGELLFGAIGRLDQQKGQSYLIEAMARLNRHVAARCVVIGAGPRRAALEALVHKHHLEQSVILLGERDDVPAWLSSLDVFVLPSLWEGLPNALLEAMALGLPVIASAVDGVPEVVEDGKTGLLVSPRDPAALAQKLSALASDPALRQRLGEGAKALIAEKFTLIRMIESYQKAYRDVLTPS